MDKDMNDDDLTTYAEGLGVGHEDSDLLWLVQEAFHATLPLSWSEHTDDEGRLYFFREASGESSWEHPMDAVYRELVGLVKQARSSDAMYAMTQESMAARARLIHTHLRQVHQHGLEALEGWSGPYASTEGEYYYNEALRVSVWESPLMEWSHELILRHDVLCRCLLPEYSMVGADGNVEHLSPAGGVPRVSGAELLQHLQLNLELVKRGESDGSDQPQSPATSRDYLTARSGASTTRSQISSGDRARAAAHASASAAAVPGTASGLAVPGAGNAAAGSAAAAAYTSADAAAGGSKRAPKPPPPPPQEEKVTIYTRPADVAAGGW